MMIMGHGLMTIGNKSLEENHQKKYYLVMATNTITNPSHPTTQYAVNATIIHVSLNKSCYIYIAHNIIYVFSSNNLKTQVSDSLMMINKKGHL